MQRQHARAGPEEALPLVRWSSRTPGIVSSRSPDAPSARLCPLLARAALATSTRMRAQQESAWPCSVALLRPLGFREPRRRNLLGVDHRGVGRGVARGGAVAVDERPGGGHEALQDVRAGAAGARRLLCLVCQRVEAAAAARARPHVLLVLSGQVRPKVGQGRALPQDAVARRTLPREDGGRAQDLPPGAGRASRAAEVVPEAREEGCPDLDRLQGQCLLGPRQGRVLLRARVPPLAAGGRAALGGPGHGCARRGAAQDRGAAPRQLAGRRRVLRASACPHDGRAAADPARPQGGGAGGGGACGARGRGGGAEACRRGCLRVARARAEDLVADQQRRALAADQARAQGGRGGRVADLARRAAQGGARRGAPRVSEVSRKCLGSV
mmetsp:Transcript_17621/g.57803  ORF Transcript_17621/g.57803 Transcript_17621/m.57803 type:complete len:384 (+) Transcript_17621:140-1291(+)